MSADQPLSKTEARLLAILRAGRYGRTDLGWTELHEGIPNAQRQVFWKALDSLVEQGLVEKPSDGTYRAVSQ